MFGSRTAIAGKLAALLLGPGALWLTACQESRERPTGLSGSVPETTIEIREPAEDALLPADSVSTVVIAATGQLQALEVLVVRLAPVVDTLVHLRRELDPPRDFVEDSFAVELPSLVTGTPMEIVGVAENIIGERRLSDPVQVTAIDCDVFPITCRELGG